ncbi:unnamed protein product, partial [Ectocarpus sp. 12 AP-2014]
GTRDPGGVAEVLVSEGSPAESEAGRKELGTGRGRAPFPAVAPAAVRLGEVPRQSHPRGAVAAVVHGSRGGPRGRLVRDCRWRRRCPGPADRRRDGGGGGGGG